MVVEGKKGHLVKFGELKHKLETGYEGSQLVRSCLWHPVIRCVKMGGILTLCSQVQVNAPEMHLS